MEGKWIFTEAKRTEEPMMVSVLERSACRQGMR